jgi:hypothetical protein
MAGNSDIAVTGSSAGGGGDRYSAWLIQAGDSAPCVAVSTGGAHLVIRSGPRLRRQGLIV